MTTFSPVIARGLRAVTARLVLLNHVSRQTATIYRGKHHRAAARHPRSQNGREDVRHQRFVRFAVGSRSHDRRPRVPRILIKLSGSRSWAPSYYGTDPERLGAVAEQIKRVHDRGVEIRSCSARQHLPRIAGAASAWTAPPRLHGDARDRPQRAPSAGRPGEARRPYARAVGHPRAGGGRALHPPSRDAPPREGPRRHLRAAPAPVLHLGHRSGLRAVEIHAKRS